VSGPGGDDNDQLSADLLRELLVSRHERRPSQLDALNDMPLYPTDEIIWNENIVPMEYHAGGGESGLSVAGTY